MLHRRLLLVPVLSLLGIATLHAEYRQIELTIFGME